MWKSWLKPMSIVFCSCYLIKILNKIKLEICTKSVWNYYIIENYFLINLTNNSLPFLDGIELYEGSKIFNSNDDKKYFIYSSLDPP